MPFGSDALSLMAEPRRVEAVGAARQQRRPTSPQGTPLAGGETPPHRTAGAPSARTSGPRSSGAANGGARPERSWPPPVRPARPLGPSDRLASHVVVAHGAFGPCRRALGGSGSLMIVPSLIADDRTDSREGHLPVVPRPFMIGEIDPGKGFAHVLDDTTL